MTPPLDLVILGLSITSSWGNGHATTYRGLVRELVRDGHRVTFLERDVPWYAGHRDLAGPAFGEVALYADLDDLRDRFGARVREADLVIVGSYVPDGAALGAWVTAEARGLTAFYDIDTPVTLARLAQGEAGYISAELIPRYDLYLSFTGGPTLRRLEDQYGARRARPLYCAVDPELYFAEPGEPRWDLGYMGTYSADRQLGLERLLLEPARMHPAGRFVVAGPQYPPAIDWPPNVERLEHVDPGAHRSFYSAQRWTLNVTRRDMVLAGWSPSVRLFEAAACGVPILSDDWEGLGEFFRLGEELLVVRSGAEVLQVLRERSEEERRAIGGRARATVLRRHTAAHRAGELLAYVEPLLPRRRVA